MSLTPHSVKHYHIFLASPGDVAVERQHVRKFFEEFNRTIAHTWNVQFDVIDWENYATIGVGRPQELINVQTLKQYQRSLALVIGIMAQRFGSNSGKAESGTREEFDVAMELRRDTGFPEIKWFFRKIETLDGLPADRRAALHAIDQWEKVVEFRKEMQNLNNNPVFYTEYPSSAGFAEVFNRDLSRWLADPVRPWRAAVDAPESARVPQAIVPQLPEFDAERYRAAVISRFDKLNFEMLDTTGAYYSGVRLWSVFVPQSVRECHQYNPRLLEISKEHQLRLLKAGEISAEDLVESQEESDRLRQKYFSQPIQPVLRVVDEAMSSGSRIVVLGDPGSGKSSLIRYLALRWARLTKPEATPQQPVPLVVELGGYARWTCDGKKDFIRFLEEGPGWHSWPPGLLDQLLRQRGRIVLLLDGLDEVFDPTHREAVVNDIHRFTTEFPHAPIVVTSRVVGYQSSRLRDADFRHYMLQDLDSDQIISFIDLWHGATFDDEQQAAPKRDRLHKAIRNTQSIASLAGNPLLLTMMAILNRNQELPRDRTELYDQASRVLLHQWDTERALADFPGSSAEIGLRDKIDILRRVAAYMQAGPGGLKGNMIDGETLTGLIDEYLRTERHFTQARAAARAVVEQLRQRNFILCFVGADSYAFVHRTFLEYFCAADFVHQFNVAKTLDIDGLIALFDEHRSQDEWREVLRLICGQVDESFVSEIVKRLISRIDLDDWDSDPIPELTLAIGCLSEARNIARLEDANQSITEILLRIYIPGKGTQAFHEQILAAARDIGNRWLNAASISQIVLKRKNELDGKKWAMVYLVKFLACVCGDRSSIEKFAVSQNYVLRWGAAEALVEHWPDKNTRALLVDRAVQDDDSNVRCIVLRALSEKWPDEKIREFLTNRAVQDDGSDVRGTALRALSEKWPDEKIRELLTNRAVQDDDSDVRSTALQALSEKWPDGNTREFLTNRAVQDDDSDVRSTALRALSEKWPDGNTREFLTNRAAQDTSEDVRALALRVLAQKWPDEKTRELLDHYCMKDASELVRGAAGFGISQSHSRFGRLLMSRDSDGLPPFLDPWSPISHEHIEQAAEMCGISKADIAAQVAALSAHMGWDITRGAKPAKRTGKRKRKDGK